MDNWIKVERGIRYREHPTRKYGVPRRPDKYYVIRIAVDGVMRQVLPSRLLPHVWLHAIHLCIQRNPPC